METLLTPPIRETTPLDTSSFPKYLAIIPDGNRRWAKREGVSIREGHQVGGDNMLPIVRAAHKYGVKEVTFYVFSTENWSRSSIEIRTLFFLFQNYLSRMGREMVEEGVSFHAIGDLAALPSSLVRTIHATEEKTQYGEKIRLILALNYGGRDEICRAIQKIFTKFDPVMLQKEKITEQLIRDHMDTAPFSDPDLIIRTSGEQRLSNFLLWQSSYSELYTTHLLWPEFSAKDLLASFQDFAKRERRLGGV